MNIKTDHPCYDDLFFYLFFTNTDSRKQAGLQSY